MRYSHSLSILLLSFSGVLFAGYLSAVKFFTATCALGEGCPYFLGYPSCYYGLAMYLLLVLASALLYSGGTLPRTGRLGAIVVSFAGILFAGYFTLGELPVLFAQGLGVYVLGLPSCAYGLLVYIAIFLLALTAKRQETV